MAVYSATTLALPSRGEDRAARDALFFFSSRRRHTRSTRDWSSDVCSSDLRKKVKKTRAREGQSGSGAGSDRCSGRRSERRAGSAGEQRALRPARVARRGVRKKDRKSVV